MKAHYGGTTPKEKMFSSLLMLGTFYLSNARRRKLCTASETNTPSAWSFTCSAQIKWGTAAGTFVLWPKGRGKGQSACRKGTLPSPLYFPETAWARAYFENWALSKHCTFLRTRTALLSTKCHWHPSHPRVLLPRSWQSGLRVSNVKIICIFFLT